MSGTIRPSAVWYIVAATIFVAACIGVIVLSAGLVDEVSEILDFEIHRGASPFAVELEKTGSYTVYSEVSRVVGKVVTGREEFETPAKELVFEVVGPDGQALETGEALRTHLTKGDLGYIPLATFDVERVGTHEIRYVWPDEVEPTDVTLAVGRSLPVSAAGGFVGTVFVIIALLLVGAGGALGVFFVTLARRMGSKRRLEAEAMERLVAERRPRTEG